MSQLEPHKLHHCSKHKDVFETCLQVLRSTRYPKNFNFYSNIFKLFHHSISIPHLDDLTHNLPFFDISICKQIFYETSKYCILFQFISPPLNYFVTITKVKLSLNHILKFISYSFYHKSWVLNPSSKSKIIVYTHLYIDFLIIIELIINFIKA